MNSKVKAPAKTSAGAATAAAANASATAADDAAATQQAGAVTDSATTSASTDTQQATTAAADSQQGAQQAAQAPLNVAIGPDSNANGDAAQELVARGFPLSVTVTNQMPRRVTFPELQGLTLAHVAGLPELTTQPATFRNADQLHRFATDVQALCELNGFAAGVTVQAD